LDRGAQAFIVDSSSETACEPSHQLFERHDLQAVAPLACGIEAKFPHRHSAMGDDGPSV